jgi:hypothetical protein
VLYLSSTTFGDSSVAEQEFGKILMAAGLLEEAARVKIDPMEELIFSPGNCKLDLTNYFNVLRTSEQLHELIVGAISIKMLSEQGVPIYQSILQKTIKDAVEGNSLSILQDDDIDLVRTQLTSSLSDDLDLGLVSSYF